MYHFAHVAKYYAGKVSIPFNCNDAILIDTVRLRWRAYRLLSGGATAPRRFDGGVIFINLARY